MLKKKYRIRKRKDFRKIYKKGESVAGKYLVLYKFQSGTNNVRFGYSISKKIGRAIIRNKLKRRLSEICRLYRNNFKEGNDIIFIARKRINEIGFKELNEEVKLLAKKANLFKKK